MAAQKAHNLGALIFAASAWVATAPMAEAQVSNFGAEVTNVANVTYTIGGVTDDVVTAPAIFVIRKHGRARDNRRAGSGPIRPYSAYSSHDLSGR